MTHLSHWDIQNTFSAKELAALIRGIDPASPESPHLQDNDPVLTRIRDAYEAAYFELTVQWESQLEFNAVDFITKLEPTWLICGAMMALDDEEFLLAWMNSRLGESLANQKFYRTEVVRWLAHSGIPSTYAFALDPIPEALPERPVATKERNALLTIIGAMLEQLTSGRANDTTVINAAVDKHGSKTGISKRNLEKVFAEAKRILQSS